MEKPDVAETQTNGLEVLETREWLDSLDYVLAQGGPERAGRLLQQLSLHAKRAAGVNLPFTATTPYQNTIPSIQQAPFPGSQEMERRIKSLVRWNALDIFRLSHQRPLCTKSRLTTSSEPRPKPATGTWFIFKDMPRPACMLAPIWKAASPVRNWRTSAAN
jgi:hypothetical protein